MCITVLALTLSSLPFAGAGAEEKPIRGGELVFVVPAAGFPSMDAHRETTFALIHPLRPFYSLLISANPENPGDPSDFVGDLAERWTVSDNGRTYAFRLRKDVKFHDGSPMTSRDVKASDGGVRAGGHSLQLLPRPVHRRHHGRSGAVSAHRPLPRFDRRARAGKDNIVTRSTPEEASHGDSA